MTGSGLAIWEGLEARTLHSSNRRHPVANWQGSITLIADRFGNSININGYDAYDIANETNIGRFTAVLAQNYRASYNNGKPARRQINSAN